MIQKQNHSNTEIIMKDNMVDEQVNIQFENLLNGGDNHPLFDEEVELHIFEEVMNQDLLAVCSNITVEEIQEMNDALGDN